MSNHDNVEASAYDGFLTWVRESQELVDNTKGVLMANSHFFLISASAPRKIAHIHTRNNNVVVNIEDLEPELSQVKTNFAPEPVRRNDGA